MLTSENFNKMNNDQFKNRIERAERFTLVFSKAVLLAFCLFMVFRELELLG